MYYITTGRYCWHNKGRIILFETIEEAQAFASRFFSYAAARGVSEQGVEFMFGMMEKQSATQIEVFESEDDKDVQTIIWAELEKERATSSRSN